MSEADRETACWPDATAIARHVQKLRLTQTIADRTIDIAEVPDSVIDRLLGCGPDDHAPCTYMHLDLVIVIGPGSDWAQPDGRVTVIDVRWDRLMLLSLASLGAARSLGLVTGPALLEQTLGL